MPRTQNAPGERTAPAINKFPDKLYRDVKSRAAQKGISLKAFLIQALRYALANDHVVEGKEVVDSAHEGEQTEVRGSVSQTARAAPSKTRKPQDRRKEKVGHNNTAY